MVQEKNSTRLSDQIPQKECCTGTMPDEDTQVNEWHVWFAYYEELEVVLA